MSLYSFVSGYRSLSLQVNIKVGKTLASAIEKGEQATEATKQAVGMS